MKSKKEIEKLNSPKELKDCPWCSYDNDDPKKGIVHEAEDAVLDLTANLDYQCRTCGKHWPKSALGQPWSIELERGDAWARENKARQLTKF